MCRGRLGEGKGAGHGNADAPIERHVQRLSDLLRRRHPEAQDPVAAAEQFDDVQLHHLAAVRPARRQASVGSQRAEMIAKQLAAHGVDDRVHAAAAVRLGEASRTAISR